MKNIRYFLILIISMVLTGATTVILNDFDNYYNEIFETAREGYISENIVNKVKRLGELVNFKYQPEDYSKKKKELLKTGDYSIYVNIDLKTDQIYQETAYYCGPAAIQTALNYYNFMDLSQDEAAIFLRTSENGTNIEDIAKVLSEENTKGHHYEVVNVYSKEELAYHIKDSLRRGKIVIPEVSTVNINWPYFTDGHYFVISGAQIYSKGMDENGYPIEPFGIINISDSAWSPKEGTNTTYTLDQVFEGVENFWGSWIVK